MADLLLDATIAKRAPANLRPTQTYFSESGSAMRGNTRPHIGQSACGNDDSPFQSRSGSLNLLVYARFGFLHRFLDSLLTDKSQLHAGSELVLQKPANASE